MRTYVRLADRLQAFGKVIAAMRAIVFVLLWTASAILAPFAGAQTGNAGTATGTAGTAIVVLDGSGSMGGPLEGQKDVKFDMASQALLKLLPTAAPQSRTGLVTFGNRRKGDCSDADVAVPAASANLDQFTSVFSRIGPTGKGPLVQGVREAAKALPTDGPGTLIVIHDDMDNCRQDVCAAAADLAKITPKVTVHVITVSLDKTTSEKMSCLAAITGGRVFEGRDAASVESSLAEALRLARVIDPTVQAAPEAPQAAAPVPEAAGPPSVRLAAGLTAAGPALAAPVQWRILTVATPGEPGTPGEIVKQATVPVLTTELAAGSYVVEARYGLAQARQTIEVAAQGQTQTRVSLEAANIKISNVTIKGPGTLSGPLTPPMTPPMMTVSALGDKSAPPKPVYIGQEHQADLVVPAGSYRVSVRNGLAGKQQDITVAAGDVTPIDFSLGTGRLELSSQNREGGEPLEGTAFIIATDDPDAPQGRREVTRSAAPHPNFELPAGTYYVIAKLGAAETKERIAIGTGDVVKRAITLNGAWTKLTANFEGGLALKDIAVMCRILGKGKDGLEVARITSQNGAGTADIFLPQGSYRFECTVGHHNVTGATEVDVAAGPKATVTIAVAMSELTLLPVTGAAAATGWHVSDGQGRVVQRSAATRSQKILLVSPGRYVVRIEQRDDHLDKPIELKPGERRSVNLGPN